MKKTILTLITICAFAITNAQVKTKINHNTVRSIQSRGIMVKKDIKGKFNASKIRKLKIWELPTKDYVLLSEDNHYYTYDGNETIVKKYFKTTLQSQTKMGCPDGSVPSNGGCFRFVQLCTSSSSMELEDEGEDQCLLINYVEDINTVNLTGKIVINQNNKIYVTRKNKALLNLIKDAEQSKKMLKQNSSDCEDGCFCFGGNITCVDIKDDFPSYKRQKNTVKKMNIKNIKKN